MLKGENRLWEMQELSRRVNNSISNYWHYRNLKKYSKNSNINLKIHLNAMKSAHDQLGELINQLETLHAQKNTD